MAPSEHHILLNCYSTTRINLQTKYPSKMFHTLLRIIGVLSRNTQINDINPRVQGLSRGPWAILLTMFNGNINSQYVI